MRRVLIVLIPLILVVAAAFFLLKSALLKGKWPLSSFTPPEIVEPVGRQGSSLKYLYYALPSGRGKTLEVYRAKTEDLRPEKVFEIEGEVSGLTLLNSDRGLYLTDIDETGRAGKIKIIDFRAGESTDFSFAPKSGYLINKIVVNSSGTKAAVWETKKDDFVFSESIVEVLEIKSGKRETWLAQNGAEFKYPVGWLGDSLIFDTASKEGAGQLLGLYLFSKAGSLTRILGTGEYSGLPTVSPDQKKLAFTGFNPKAAKIIRASETAVKMLSEAALNPNQIKIWDGAPRILRESLNEGRLFDSLAFSTDSKKIIARRSKISADLEETEAENWMIIDTEGKIPSKDIGLLGPGAVIGWVDEKTVFLAARTAALGGFSDFPSISEGIYKYDLETKRPEKVLTDKYVMIIGIK